MKKIVIQFTVMFIITFLLFKYNIQIKNDLEIILTIFFKNIIFSMFPIIYISTYIKYNTLPYIKNKILKFICFFFSYAPSNAIISMSNNELIYSLIINPLFSYTVLINYYSLKNVLIIIIVNLLFNYFFLYRNISINYNYGFSNASFTQIIKETIFNLINILGVIVFFNIIISLCSIFISTKFLFFIEITNGFKIISKLNNVLIKKILFIFLNSFGGLAIFFQIKSIKTDANYIIIIKKICVSLIVTLITLILTS